MSSKLLERGHIFFLYRPKIGHSHVSSLDDVARMHLMLVPEKVTNVNKCRMIVIPKKRLPTIKPHEIHLAIVDEVTKDIDRIRKDVMEKRHYLTPIRQEERVTEPDRLVAEGVYMLDLAENKASHLSYILEVPKETGNVQEIMHIEREGSFAVTVKNPKYSYQGRQSEATFPDHLLDLFHNNKFLSVLTPELLNVEKADLLLIGATHDLEHVLHEHAKELEKISEKEKNILNPHSAMQQLHLDERKHPMDPLEKGRFA